MAHKWLKWLIADRRKPTGNQPVNSVSRTNAGGETATKHDIQGATTGPMETFMGQMRHGEHNEN